MRPIYYINSDATKTATAKLWTETLAKAFHFEARFLNIGMPSAEGDSLPDWEGINDFVEANDVAILVIEMIDSKIQFYLNQCRELRVPYLMVKEGQPVDLKRVALPVTFLMEEKEKGPFASAFGRFFNSEIVFFAPKDYGTKARTNIASITKLFNSFSLTYTEIQGEKNSEKVEMEATLKAPANQCGLVIVTASREYGLDDILFGPKERKILKKTQIPVMLINPRGDLYSLCD